MSLSIDEAVYTAELVCMGAERLQGGKIGTGWLMLGAEREIYLMQSPAGATVGSVYLWTFGDSGLTKLYTKGEKGPRYVRQLSSIAEPRIPEWEARHLAVTVGRRQASKARTEQRSDLREALEPYRAAYRKLPTMADRAAYLANIIAIMTGPPR